MRFLGKTDEIDLVIDCNLGENTDNLGVLECDKPSGSNSSNIDPSKVDSNSDDIAGFPDDAKVKKNQNPDLSKKENLDTINNLPAVTIIGVTSNKCSEISSYTIDATYQTTDSKLVNVIHRFP